MDLSDFEKAPIPVRVKLMLDVATVTSHLLGKRISCNGIEKRWVYVSDSLPDTPMAYIRRFDKAEYLDDEGATTDVDVSALDAICHLSNTNACRFCNSPNSSLPTSLEQILGADQDSLHKIIVEAPLDGIEKMAAALHLSSGTPNDDWAVDLLKTIKILSEKDRAPQHNAQWLCEKMKSIDAQVSERSK